MKDRPALNVVSDQVGSPTYAADLAAAIMDLVCRDNANGSDWHPGIYHYSNEAEISWYDFAKLIKELSGSSSKINPIPTSQFPTPAKRPAYSVLDNTKIQQVYGIRLKKWEESLAVPAYI